MAKKNKDISSSNLIKVKPITEGQKSVFETWKKGQNQFLFGCAGTGKTLSLIHI